MRRQPPTLHHLLSNTATPAVPLLPLLPPTPPPPPMNPSIIVPNSLRRRRSAGAGGGDSASVATAKKLDSRPVADLIDLCDDDSDRDDDDEREGVH